MYGFAFVSEREQARERRSTRKREEKGEWVRRWLARKKASRYLLKSS